LKAYLKDIEDNPDFTSQQIKDSLEAGQSLTVGTKSKDGDPTQSRNEKDSDPPHSKKKKKEKKWLEAKTAEDSTYYWNSETYGRPCLFSIFIMPIYIS